MNTVIILQCGIHLLEITTYLNNDNNNNDNIKSVLEKNENIVDEMKTHRV